MKKKAINTQVQPVVRRKYAELANVGYPGMEGIRLRFENGTGQWINSNMFKKQPDIVVKFLNDWMND